MSGSSARALALVAKKATSTSREPSHAAAMVAAVTVVSGIKQPMALLRHGRRRIYAAICHSRGEHQNRKPRARGAHPVARGRGDPGD